MKMPEEIKKGLRICAETFICDEDCPYYDDCNDGKSSFADDALAYIQQLEVQVQKWISVEDRLPEDQRDVLTVNGHGNIRMMGFWSKRGEQLMWLHNGRFKHYNDITHWMPLPSTEGIK